jgi:hypothetical protein
VAPTTVLIARAIDLMRMREDSRKDDNTIAVGVADYTDMTSCRATRAAKSVDFSRTASCTKTKP